MCAAARSPSPSARLRLLIDEAKAADKALGAHDRAFSVALAKRAPIIDSEVHAERLHLADLYLAVACMEGDAAARSRILHTVFPSIRRALARRSFGDAVIDDVLAGLSQRLFATPDGEVRLLDAYSARGSLAGFLGRTAERLASRTYREHARTTSLDEAVGIAIAIRDPELEMLRETYASAFRAAVTEALEQLGTRDRRLLREVVVEERRSSDIARRKKVHRVTVTRWLAQIRAGVLARVESSVATRLALPVSEVRALAKIVGPDLEVSLHRLLAK